MSRDPAQPAGEPWDAGAPSEEQLRAAYEEELSRITAFDLALQAAVSLLNLGGRRLGMTGPPGQDPSAERDLEQVRDAIDGARALLEILERRRPSEVRPLRDALSQLQIAYAREARATEPASAATGPAQAGADEQAQAGEREQAPEPDAAKQAPEEAGGPHQPGPAEASGRLWVPGR